ncbi:hypothetical protein HCJ66_11365 [Listeria sp. FSL L7-1582]|uniref:hypothetical protein n=1 Tax=Listeria portnoyi TaxID=2713504 RepID=UPI00164DBCCD|nr:hypothetical protein [Listeria portnoyi]MBC6310136.1 hypothetical protein [Listeria portnoyi]
MNYIGTHITGKTAIIRKINDLFVYSTENNSGASKSLEIAQKLAHLDLFRSEEISKRATAGIELQDWFWQSTQE